MKIKVDTKDFDRFSVNLGNYAKECEPNIKKSVQETVLAIEKGAKQNLTNNNSVKTGHLRRSIASKTTGFNGEVHTSNVKYARGVEEGTRAHIIKPKGKKALYWKGAKHPVKQVNHPGSKAKPYLIPAFEDEKPKFIERLEKAVRYKG